MVGESKLDMSLDDLIKTARKKPVAVAKPTKAKPGQQGKQQKAQQGKGAALQQQKGGAKGKVAPQQLQKKGVALKAKGGVIKPGAGGARVAKPGQQQRPGQRAKGHPDVRVVPRPGPQQQRPGMRQGPGMRPMGMGPRPGMQTRFMGRGPMDGFRPPMMQQAPYMAPMGMGMIPQAAPMMAAPAPMVAAQQVAPPQQGKWQNDLFDGSVVSSSTSAKLFISNLDYKVTDEDITELFGTVGTIKESGIHYDKSGRSMGTAYVVFEKRADALAAFNRYNNVALDNKKMSIEVVETAVPRGTFKTLSSGINVSRQQQQQQQPAGGGAFKGRGMPQSVAVPQGDFMQE